jgi:hypothetical protein
MPVAVERMIRPRASAHAGSEVERRVTGVADPVAAVGGAPVDLGRPERPDGLDGEGRLGRRGGWGPQHAENDGDHEAEDEA